MVKARVQRLVGVTALLFSRWSDRDRLTAAASHDSLTGLANRETFRNAFDSIRMPSALLYIDVDRFKLVNDRFGHDVGDRVLVEVADRIAAACRPEDVVARLGGDEFVVLLSGTSQSVAYEVGQRILKDVAAPLMMGDGPDRVAVSMGLAPVTNVDDTVSAADHAMLRAKRNGRAQLVLAGSSKS